MLADALSTAQAVDLTVPFQILALICSLLSLYVMQQTWHDLLSQEDPPWLQQARRLSFVILTLGLAWSASYVDSHGTRPTPPGFLIVVALTLVFFIRAVLLHRHRNDGRVMPPTKLPQARRPF